MTEVQAEIVFASRITKDGKKHWVEGGVSNPRSNYDERRHLTNITDISTDQTSFKPTIDDNGFEFTDLSTAEQGFTDESAITNHYYSEVEQFLLRRTGASRVVIFDHTIRRPGTARGPVARAHVDQTERAALVRVERHAPEEMAGLTSNGGTKHFQLINVWRPISHTAWNNPLALCDYASIGPGDMIETDRVDFAKLDAPPGETFSVAFNASQRWYYHKNLRQDQVVLIKCYDSRTQVARLCPHTAFTDPSSEADKPERESIELRCLVFHH